jgi:hypothetical protein
MSELQPFDRERVCWACGSGSFDEPRGALVAFCNSHCIRGVNTWIDAPALRDAGLGHIHRTCRRCGYQWLEAPLAHRNGVQPS